MKMNCFYIFKAKLKNKREVQSDQALRCKSKSDDSALNRSDMSLSSPKSILELYKENEHNLRVFSYEELRDATHCFNKLLKIGEGGFGNVYKGTVKPANGQGESIVVAIKKLNTHGLQGHKQWLAEVQFLGVLSHPNLVKLLGYCSLDGERGNQRLLVYEYVANKTLEHHLFNPKLPSLPWKRRLEIMLGAAQGLAYLHEGLEVKVIYRDFKSSNVLLDENFKPKLSDFGMAREGPSGDRTHVSTAVVGTYGYAAPEYVETGHLTIQSDIWTFGVVLFEILTGRRAVERNRPTREQKLLNWVKQYPPDSKLFTMVMDPRLGNQYPINAARTIAKLAETCLAKNAKERPTMNQVVKSLKEAIQESEKGAPSANPSSAKSSSTKAEQRSKKCKLFRQ